jgi:hypothetical protein
MTVEVRERPLKISQRKPQMGNLLAGEFDHEAVFVLSMVPGTCYIFAGALKQLSQQK